MTQTIVVPEGEDGDEIVMELLPQLHRIAVGERRDDD